MLATVNQLGLPDIVKKFNLGLAAGALFYPIPLGIETLAQKVGLLIPGEVSLALIGYLVNGAENHGIPIDANKITNAPCRFNALATQINNSLSERDHVSPFTLKSTLFLEGVIQAPIIEEVFFRGIVQGMMLKQIPSWVAKRYAPKLNLYLDSTVAKIARITITAVLFSATHYLNHGQGHENYVQGQILTALIGGIALGSIKESNLGLLGAIGAHIAHNFISIIPTLLMC